MQNPNPCPHCGCTPPRTYRRTIHKEMANFMKRLATFGVGVPVDIRRQVMPNAAKACTDASYLVHWGMVEKPKRGVYSLTLTGQRFLEGNLMTDKYLHMRGGQVVDKSGMMMIFDVKGFDERTL